MVTWANVCDDIEMRTYLAWLAARNRFDRRTSVKPTHPSGGTARGERTGSAIGDVHSDHDAPDRSDLRTSADERREADGRLNQAAR